MIDEQSDNNTPLSKIESLHEGQRIIYNGKEADVVKTEPVIIIKIRDRNELVCGNVMHEVSLV